MPELIGYDPSKVVFSPVTLAQFAKFKQITLPNVELAWGWNDFSLNVEILAKHGLLKLAPNATIFDEILARMKTL